MISYMRVQKFLFRVSSHKASESLCLTHTMQVFHYYIFVKLHSLCKLSLVSKSHNACFVLVLILFKLLLKVTSTISLQIFTYTYLFSTVFVSARILQLDGCWDIYTKLYNSQICLWPLTHFFHFITFLSTVACLLFYTLSH